MRKRKTDQLFSIIILFSIILLLFSLIRYDASASDGSATLRVQAFPLKAVTGRQDQQTIYIIVQDQNFIPVQGAEASLSLLLPDGSEQRLIVIQPTGPNGMAQIAIPVSSEKVGLVIVNVHAARSRMEAETSTSFRIWW